MDLVLFDVDGVMHFGRKQEAAICLLIENSDSTEFGNKCNSGVTGFGGKVRLIIYCTEDRVGQNCH